VNLLQDSIVSDSLEMKVMAARRRRSPPTSPGDQGRSFSSSVQPAWLTVTQVCHRWQLGRKTVYKFITSNILPAWKVGPHLYRIAIDDLLRFEAENTSFTHTSSTPPTLDPNRSPDPMSGPAGDKLIQRR
jgi:excisionase family DNA binding protein